MQYPGKKTFGLNVYEGIDELPLYNFDRYRATSDNNWLRRDFTGRETKVEAKLIKPFEEVINEQYYKATDDRSFQLTIQMFAKINALETKYICVIDLIQLMSGGFAHDAISQNIRAGLIKQMNAWGFRMNIIASPLEDYQRLQEINDTLPGIRTQIRIIEQQIKQKGEVATRSLRKQLKMVQLALGAKSEYDPKTLTVANWIEDVKLMDELSKKN